MEDTCVLCFEELGDATATTGCGHTFHTKCLGDNIALNVGSEVGTTRHLCPLCRTPVCEEVQPSKNITVRLDDLTVNVEILSNTNAAWATYCEKIEKENKSLQKANTTLATTYRAAINQSQWTWSKRHDCLLRNFETLKENYRKEKFISERRLVALRSRIGAQELIEPISRQEAAIRIQNWLRCLRAIKTATLKKHRRSWTIYKKIADKTIIYKTSPPGSTSFENRIINIAHRDTTSDES